MRNTAAWKRIEVFSADQIRQICCGGVGMLEPGRYSACGFFDGDPFDSVRDMKFIFGMSAD